ncbi:MAG TPA: nuclear transport factor 2 family protein [Candidatus Dormibacteraeota bacterium]|nr:nuclear transport factor 2 family protein [Candidatus Dormibacteraeota bacterium]
MAETGTKLNLDQKIQVVRDAFDSFKRGDMKALSDAWSDDIVWHGRGSTKFGGEFKGKEAVLGNIVQYPQEFQDIRLDIHDILASDKHVVALVNSSSKRNGQAYDDQLTYVFHISDQGKATEAWLIGDTELLKKVLES